MKKAAASEARQRGITKAEQLRALDALERIGSVRIRLQTIKMIEAIADRAGVVAKKMTP